MWRAVAARLPENHWHLGSEQLHKQGALQTASQTVSLGKVWLRSSSSLWSSISVPHLTSHCPHGGIISVLFGSNSSLEQQCDILSTLLPPSGLPRAMDSRGMVGRDLKVRSTMEEGEEGQDSISEIPLWSPLGSPVVVQHRQLSNESSCLCSWKKTQSIRELTSLEYLSA